MHTIGNNFSAGAVQRVLVIINFFLLSVLTNKYDLDGEKRHYWIKRVRFQITEMLKRGNLRSVALVLISAKEFLEVLLLRAAVSRDSKKIRALLFKKKKDTTLRVIEQLMHCGENQKVLWSTPFPIMLKQKATIPLGLLSLATHLTQAGHTVELFDRAVDGGGMSKRLRGFKPDIVGVSSLGIMSFDDAIKVS
jgi:hypothetical protein